MKHMRKNLQRGRGSCMSNHKCRVCSNYRPILPSRVANHNWICNPCAYRKSKSDFSQYMAKKLSVTLRKRGHRPPYPGVSFARAVLKKCSWQSVMSGDTEIKHLCLVLSDTQKGWTVENTVVVTSAEAGALSRTLEDNHRRTLLMGRPNQSN
jgi:ribosomal protein L37AE/L43A